MFRRAGLREGWVIALCAWIDSTPCMGQLSGLEEDETRLIAAAGLQPVDVNQGEILRYVLQRAYGRPGPFTAQIVQVQWPYEAPYPRILLIELATREGASSEWQVTERREAFMQRPHFDRLVDNVVAAASAVGVRPDRGAVNVCDHGPAARLDISLPTLELWTTRTSHSRCSGDDEPAIIAGELLAKAVQIEIELDWRPPG